MALRVGSSSATQILQSILEARKGKWDQAEQRRVIRSSSLLTEITTLLRNELDKAVKKAKNELEGGQLEEELKYLNSEHKEKVEDLISVFASSDDRYRKKPEVPSYLLDPISFNLFVDPVITKSGQSFERAWILEHLAKSETDPFSRQPLKKSDLIPNIQLKIAAEDFMTREGNF